MPTGDPPVHTCTATATTNTLTPRPPCVACAQLFQPFARIAAAWECPRCRVINAPHVDRCSCSPPATFFPAPSIPSLPPYFPPFVPQLPLIPSDPIGPTWVPPFDVWCTSPPSPSLWEIAGGARFDVTCDNAEGAS